MPSLPGAHNLRNVEYNRALRVSYGKFVHNYHELLFELKTMSEYEFKKLVGKGYNRITSWISENYNDSSLISKLKTAHSRRRYASILEKHIKKTEREHKKKKNTIASSENENKKINPDYAIVSLALFFFCLILITALIAQNNYFNARERIYEHQIESLNAAFPEIEAIIREYENKIIVLEQKTYELELEKQLLEEEKRITLHEVTIPYVQRTYGPADRVRQENIVLTSEGAVIYLRNMVMSAFADTGSMLPVITSTSHALQIVPVNESQLYLGDIISYEDNQGRTIIHRISGIGNDENGWYAIAKGDNNPMPDPEKIRFSQIKRVLIAIIY